MENKKLSLREILQDAVEKNTSYAVKYVDYVPDAWTTQTPLTQKEVEKILGDDSISKIRIVYDFEKEVTVPQDEFPRYFVDIRSGCGAVRDRKHENYNERYPGLHHDTSDVVEYKHGFQGKGTWNMLQEDIDYLNNLCNRLNRAELNIKTKDDLFFEEIEFGTELFNSLVGLTNLENDKVQNLIQNQIFKLEVQEFSKEANNSRAINMLKHVNSLLMNILVNGREKKEQENAYEINKIILEILTELRK